MTDARRLDIVLHRSPALAGLEPAHLDWLRERLTPVRARRRDVLWHAGAPSERALLLRSGVVRLHASALREPLIDVIPRLSLIGLDDVRHGTTIHTATAHTDLLAYALSADDTRLLLQRAPKLALTTSSLASIRHQRTTRRLARTLYGSARGRLIGALLDLAEDFGIPDGRGTLIDLKLTQHDLGSYTGLTRETIGALLGALRAEGILTIDAKRPILIDRQRLLLAA